MIDGVTEALTLEGLSLNDNSEVAEWLERLPRWIRDRTAAAAVVIDHVTKDRESRAGSRLALSTSSRESMSRTQSA